MASRATNLFITINSGQKISFLYFLDIQAGGYVDTIMQVLNNYMHLRTRMKIIKEILYYSLFKYINNLFILI